MQDAEPDCDICGRNMDDKNATRERCEQCGRTGCDHCVQRYGQDYEDGDYEEWSLCEDCYFGDCRDKH
jgi:hypothetical protein